MGQVNIVFIYSNILSCKLSNNKFLASTEYCPLSSLAYNWTSLQQFTKYSWEDITSPSIFSSSMINGHGGYFLIVMKNFQVTTWPLSSHFICFSTSTLISFFFSNTFSSSRATPITSLLTAFPRSSYWLKLCDLPTFSSFLFYTPILLGFSNT